MTDYIESMQARADTVLKKEKDLIAAEYVKRNITDEKSLGPGEYMLKSFHEVSLKMIIWRNPQINSDQQ